MFKNVMFFILFPVLLFGQENHIGKSVLYVDYTHAIHVKGAPAATVVDATLSANEVASVYEMDFMGEKEFVEEERSESGTALRIKAKTNDFVYKEFAQRNFFSILRISMKPFLVKDTMSIFNWEIKDEFKDILGYKCQKATTHYRGRIYEVFFTTELPFQNGPWKFSNLPGLILEANSLDNVLKIKAYKIQMKNAEVEINNPFKNEMGNSISWTDFIMEYKKKYQEYSHFRGPNGSTRTLPKEGIEIYIE